MKPFTSTRFHAWMSIPGIYMLSDEDLKQLKTFRNTDDMINWLYVHDHKETARSLNKHVKGN